MPKKEEKWFEAIENEMRRTGCGPDCEGPTPASKIKSKEKKS